MSYLEKRNGNPASSYMEGVIKLMNRLPDMEEGQ
jgi:hypothetical protein